MEVDEKKLEEARNLGRKIGKKILERIKKLEEKHEIVPLVIVSQHEYLHKLVSKHDEITNDALLELEKLEADHDQLTKQSWYDIESELLDKGIIKERGLHLRIENDIIYQVKGE